MQESARKKSVKLRCIGRHEIKSECDWQLRDTAVPVVFTDKKKRKKKKTTSSLYSHSYINTHTMDSKADSGTKKKFVRKVAPSKAPGRVLKKQLRNMERLLKNKDTLKDLPTEVVAETEKKIADIKKKIEALGPQASPAAATAAPKSGKPQVNNSVSKGGIKATGKSI
jgi:uncharacterized protein YlbG (UPF0298 family)